MFSKVYYFLVRSLSLSLSLFLSLSLSLSLCWRITQVKNTQIVKGYLRIALDFPQILLTTTGTFHFSFPSLVSSVFMFSLVSFTFCVCVFLFETKNIYSDTHLTMRAGKRWKKIHSTNFVKHYYFFLPYLMLHCLLLYFLMLHYFWFHYLLLLYLMLHCVNVPVIDVAL